MSNRTLERVMISGILLVMAAMGYTSFTLSWRWQVSPAILLQTILWIAVPLLLTATGLLVTYLYKQHTRQHNSHRQKVKR